MEDFDRRFGLVVLLHRRSPWLLVGCGLRRAAKPLRGLEGRSGRRGCAVKGGSAAAGAARRRSRGLGRLRGP